MNGYTWARTFASLQVPNYRRYVAAQLVSLVGTWMQMTAQTWLVVTLTGSATALGLLVALQTLPVLLLGPYAGLVVDRVDKRRLLFGMQIALAVTALGLTIMVATGAATYVRVCVFAVLLGLCNCFVNPASQAFVRELVGQDRLVNAVSLNSTMVSVARAAGPAVAGVLIAWLGEAWCFGLNALSFIPIVVVLATLDRNALHPSRSAPRARGQLREGFRSVRADPRLWGPLVMMALVGTLAYEFQVTLPLFAREVFHGGASTFGFMTAAMGVGAVAGGLATAARSRTGVAVLTVKAVAFGAAMTLVVFSPLLVLAYAALAITGFASVAFLATGNSSLQMAADPQMRGRVMALWAMAFLGSTPIGGPLVGWTTSIAGARVAIGVGAASCLAAAALGWWIVRRWPGCTTAPVVGALPAGEGVEVVARDAGDRGDGSQQ